MRRGRASVLLGVFLLLSCARAAALEAQEPDVLPQRDLTVGDVFAGVPKSITPLDAANSGFYRIEGQAFAEVVITFTLPNDLLSASAQTLPIAFGANDARFGWFPIQVLTIPFDPNVPFTVRLGFTGVAVVWLGGTVNPAPNQSAGLYEADVVMTVTYTGN